MPQVEVASTRERRFRESRDSDAMDTVAMMLAWAVLGCFVVCFVAHIWLLVVAFRTGLGWGLACLFIPFAVLAFVGAHWGVAKRPFLAALTAWVALMLGGALLGRLKPAHSQQDLQGDGTSVASMRRYVELLVEPCLDSDDLATAHEVHLGSGPPSPHRRFARV